MLVRAAQLTLSLVCHSHPCCRPDTAQSYRNEVEAGKALSAFPRDKVFLTTKYSGVDGLDIPTSIKNSLKNLGTSYVDLYLIHSPRLARPDIKTVWAQMEAVKAAGCVASCCLLRPSPLTLRTASRAASASATSTTASSRSSSSTPTSPPPLTRFALSSSARESAIIDRRRQILLHPYVYKDQMATMAFCAKHDIVVEAYSALLFALIRPPFPTHC
jgi:hypothetical protein